MADLIDVTVIGGYLGAGKTTLVNHLLRSADARVAVLVNDFGDIDIDADLIESNRGDTIALTNGCICCSLVDGFAGALDTITKLSPRPERLVIEASGVSDPNQVAAYAHAPGLSLDAVVVVADIETVVARTDDRYVGDVVMQQLEAANVIVANKTDLVDDAYATVAIDWLREQFPEAVLVATDHGRVPLDVLIGLDQPAARSSATHSHADDRFEAWTLRQSGAVERRAVERIMTDLPDSVVRAKGFVELTDDPRTHVLQRVGHRWTLRPQTTDTSRSGLELVLIGQRGAVDQAWLEARLDPDRN